MSNRVDFNTLSTTHADKLKAGIRLVQHAKKDLEIWINIRTPNGQAFIKRYPEFILAFLSKGENRNQPSDSINTQTQKVNTQTDKPRKTIENVLFPEKVSITQDNSILHLEFSNKHFAEVYLIIHNIPSYCTTKIGASFLNPDAGTVPGKFVIRIVLPILIHVLPEIPRSTVEVFRRQYLLVDGNLFYVNAVNKVEIVLIRDFTLLMNNFSNTLPFKI